MFELWPTVRLLWKPMGQLEYVIAPVWAQAVRPPRQSAASTNARPDLLMKTNIRTAAKSFENIRSRYQECQRAAAASP
jgi:hypothetical protein